FQLYFFIAQSYDHLHLYSFPTRRSSDLIGARDMAFPKLNALSFWLLTAGGLVFYASIFFDAPECGWTCYSPLSDDTYLPSGGVEDRKSTRLNSSHVKISYAVFCLKKKNK